MCCAGDGCARLLRGVYVAAQTDVTLALRAKAALLAAPSGSVVSHHTAACLWSAIVPDSSDIWLTSAQAKACNVDGLRVMRSEETPPSAVRSGIPLTDPDRTFLDLAAHLELVDLVVLGDSLVQHTSITPEGLVAAAGQTKRRWARRARRAAALVRSGVDSPMETRLRLLIVLAGLPEPEVNHIIRDEQGAWVYRFDLA